MSEPIQRFPLQWPAGWRRSKSHSRASFSSFKRALSVADGAGRVLGVLDKMGIRDTDVVISTNVPTRLDGLPRSDKAEPADSGAAAYWQRRGKTECIAVDQYDRVADNLAAIAATLEAMRAIDRHGGATILDRAFQGFAALPAPESWWMVLGLKGPDVSETDIRQAHRRLISEHHPDNGGDSDKAARINRARDQGLEAI